MVGMRLASPPPSGQWIPAAVRRPSAISTAGGTITWPRSTTATYCASCDAPVKGLNAVRACAKSVTPEGSRRRRRVAGDS